MKTMESGELSKSKSFNGLNSVKEFDQMKEKEDLNLSSVVLTPLVFKGNVLSTLLNYGLINVYLDDYGYKKKHTGCLFFLIKINTVADFQDFEDKITSFNSFYDYYDIPEEYGRNLRMYVFSVKNEFRYDLIWFQNKDFQSLSKDFKDIVDHRRIYQSTDMDVSREIFRFKEYLHCTELTK